MTESIRNLSYEAVYKNLPESYKEQIFALWEGVLPEEVQQQRIDQVAVIAKDEHGHIAGVSTAYIDKLQSVELDYYFLRVFVCEECRSRVINRGGPSFITTARDFFQNYTEQGVDAKGIAVFLENEKVSAELMESFGLRRLRADPSGRTWYYNFDGSVFDLPENPQNIDVTDSENLEELNYPDPVMEPHIPLGMRNRLNEAPESAP